MCEMGERVPGEMCMGDVRRRSFWTSLRLVSVGYLTLSFVLVEALGNNRGGDGDNYKYHKVPIHTFLFDFPLSAFTPIIIPHYDVTITALSIIPKFQGDIYM